MKFKLKNIVLVSLLAVAGLFGIGSLAINNLVKENIAAEKADAAGAYRPGTAGRNVYVNSYGTDWSDCRMVLQRFENSGCGGANNWYDFSNISVLGDSNSNLYVANCINNAWSFKFLRVNPSDASKVWNELRYDDLNYAGTANVYKITKPSGYSGNWDSDAYNIYTCRINVTGGTGAYIANSTESDKITAGNFGYIYKHITYKLNAGTPTNGWSFKEWKVTTGSATIANTGSATTTVTNINDDTVIEAVWENPWTSYTMQYSWNNSTWVNMTSGTQDGCLRKFYTSAAISQTSGQALYLRYNNGSTNVNVTTSQMGLVGGEGANNFKLVSSRPTIRFSNVTGYIDVRVTHDGSSLHFYCWAKGINDNNGQDGDSNMGRFSFIINGTRFERSTYSYNSGSDRGKKDEWKIASINLTQGDTIKFINEHTTPGSGTDYGTDFNVQYVDVDKGANGISLHNGVATVDYTGTFELYVVWGSSGFDYLYCNRLTRIVSYNMKGHGSQIDPNNYVTTGSKISAPSPAPTADGYDFQGWYKESACTTAWNFGSDTVSNDTVLYAKWVSGVDAAITFATNFNSDIGGICKYDESTNKEALASAWGSKSTNFSGLPEYVKYWLDEKEGTASSDSNVTEMFAKYKYVYGKYGTSLSLTDFLAGKLNAYAFQNYGRVSPFNLIGEDNFSTVIIVIASSVALLSVTVLSILVIRKRKSKEQ